MYNTLQKIEQSLAMLRQMTPEEWAGLDDDAWQLAQDVRDCCKALADRVDVLEMLAPIPVRECPESFAEVEPIILDRVSAEPSRL